MMDPKSQSLSLNPSTDMGTTLDISAPSMENSETPQPSSKIENQPNQNSEPVIPITWYHKNWLRKFIALLDLVSMDGSLHRAMCEQHQEEFGCLPLECEMCKAGGLSLNPIFLGVIKP